MSHRFLLTILHIYVLLYLSPPQTQSGLLPQSAGQGCPTYAFLHWPRTWVLWRCDGTTECKYSHFHQEPLLLNQFSPASTCSQQDTTLSPPLRKHKKNKTSWVLVFLVPTYVASSWTYQLVSSIPAPLTPSSRPSMYWQLPWPSHCYHCRTLTTMIRQCSAGGPSLLAPCRGVLQHPFYILVVDIVFCTAINWFFLYSERWQKNDERWLQSDLGWCYVTAGTFARRGLSSTAKTLRSLVWCSRFWVLSPRRGLR